MNKGKVGQEAMEAPLTLEESRLIDCMGFALTEQHIALSDWEMGRLLTAALIKSRHAGGGIPELATGMRPADFIGTTIQTIKMMKAFEEANHE